MAEVLQLSSHLSITAASLQDSARALWAPTGGQKNDVQAAACVLAAARLEGAAVTAAEAAAVVHLRSAHAPLQVERVAQRVLRAQPVHTRLPAAKPEAFIDRSLGARAPLAARRDARKLMQLCAAKKMHVSPACAVVCAHLAAYVHDVHISLHDAACGAFPADELMRTDKAVRQSLAAACSDCPEIFSSSKRIPWTKVHLHVRSLVQLRDAHGLQLVSSG